MPIRCTAKQAVAVAAASRHLRGRADLVQRGRGADALANAKRAP